MFWFNKGQPAPKIKVIKVKQRTGDKEVIRESRGTGYSDKTTEIHKGVDTTIVLLIKDGELMTKEFNGHWDLDDIRVIEQEETS